jgi:hypothetical protein
MREERSGPKSRFGYLRVCLLAIRHARFELPGSFGELFRYFAKKLRRTPLRFWSHFIFHIFAEPGKFFIQTAANFFKFVHKFLAPEQQARFRYYRNA